MRAVIIEQYRKTLSEEATALLGQLAHSVSPGALELPASWWNYVGKDKLLQLYFEENIRRGCQLAVHERIISDTSRIKTFELGQVLKRLEKRLYEEANKQDIDIPSIQDQVNKEMKLEESVDKAVDELKSHIAAKELVLVASDDEAEERKEAAAFQFKDKDQP